MSDKMSTATHRMTRPSALAMRTILGGFSLLVRSVSLCCHRLGHTLQLPVSKNTIRCASVHLNGKLAAGGEDAADRSALIPPPALPAPHRLLSLTPPPGGRFSQGDGTEICVNTCSHYLCPLRFSAAVCTALHQLMQG